MAAWLPRALLLAARQGGLPALRRAALHRGASGARFSAARIRRGRTGHSLATDAEERAPGAALGDRTPRPDPPGSLRGLHGADRRRPGAARAPHSPELVYQGPGQLS